MPKGYRGGGGRSGRGGYGNPVVRIIEESEARRQSNDRQFQALSDRLQREYGITLDPSLRDSQDWRGIRESIYGLESVMKEFPEAKDYLKGVTLQSGSRGLSVLGSAQLGSQVITLNNTWYRDFNNIDSVMRYGNGFHPKGSTGQSVAVHETGHLLVSGLSNKFGTSWDTTAKNVVDKALKYPAVQKTLKNNKQKSTAKWYMANKISGYASTNNHELIAEAVSDYKANGSKANVYSRAIVQELKKQYRS